MDKDGHIYKAPEDEVAPEDRARLDGYLRGLAEQEHKALRREVKALRLQMQGDALLEAPLDITDADAHA